MEIGIIEAVGTAVIALLTSALVLLASYLKKRFALQIASGIPLAALHVVKEVYQVYIEELKTAGKFDAEAKSNAKLMAMDKLKSYIGPKGVRIVMWLFEYDRKDLDAYLSSSIEAAICDAKKGK
jgi:hypothetical protein